jgi:hypothetical protein
MRLCTSLTDCKPCILYLTVALCEISWQLEFVSFRTYVLLDCHKIKFSSILTISASFTMHVYYKELDDGENLCSKVCRLCAFEVSALASAD